MDTESPFRMLKPTSNAPSQHPENSRKEDIKKLYGQNFNTIYMLEMKLQAIFDAKNDVIRAPLWPFIPIKI